MTDKKTDQQFVDAVKARFDQSVEQLDAVTLSKLKSIRRSALKGSEPFYESVLPLLFNKRALTPLVLAAGLAIAIFSVVRQTDVPGSALQAEDIEMLSASDGIDFYENLEFYQWLEDYEIST